jgi:hypothetical protein
MSTEHNLVQVVNFISNALNNGNYCIGIFLDLKKAFNVCSHDILLKKLKKYGILDNKLKWFASYLANRIQKVDVNGVLSDEKTINISVLQGTILGPLLFLIYINDIFSASDLFLTLFADDTSGLAENKNLNDLITFVNAELKKLANWFQSNKMAVNISKTKYIIFRTKGKRIVNPPPVLFNSNEVGKPEDPALIVPLERIYSDNPNVEERSYKLLGVYLDEYLNFDKHFSYICAKLTRAIYCIRRASNLISLKSLKMLYYALVHPHLLYCAVILSCGSNANLKRMATLQKKAIRIINKKPVNEPTAPLFIANNILPFFKLISYSKMMFMHAIHYKYAPPAYRNLFPANIDRNINYEMRNEHELQLPFVRIEWFRKFPLYSLPAEWNKLGIEIQHQSNKCTFSIVLKEYLFSMFVAESFENHDEP